MAKSKRKDKKPVSKQNMASSREIDGGVDLETGAEDSEELSVISVSQIESDLADEKPKKSKRNKKKTEVEFSFDSSTEFVEEEKDEQAALGEVESGTEGETESEAESNMLTGTDSDSELPTELGDLIAASAKMLANFDDEDEDLEAETDLQTEFETETEASADSDTVADAHDDFALAESEETDVEGTDLETADGEIDELAAYSSDESEPILSVDSGRVIAIIESLLFATDKPLSFDLIRQAFKGTTVKTPQIKKAIEDYKVMLADNSRGVQLEEAGGGYQLRTRTENVEFLRRSVKNRVFRLSGPALEVLAIVAYKQPVIKAQIDEIRGVDSGHLVRALMDRGLVHFGEKSDLPGRPMFYETTRKFLEIFSLRNLKELPNPSEIDELIPDGIGEPDEGERNLGVLTHELSLTTGETYSQGETELLKITDELAGIKTTTDFFEREQARQKAERELNRAQDIRDAVIMGQAVEPKDVKWLERYDKAQAAAHAAHVLAQTTASEEIIAIETAASSNESEVTEPGESYGESSSNAVDIETQPTAETEDKVEFDAQSKSNSDSEPQVETLSADELTIIDAIAQDQAVDPELHEERASHREVSAEAHAAFESEVDGVDIDKTREPAGELEKEDFEDLL